MSIRRHLALALALFSCAPNIAAADPVTVTTGATVDALTGKHDDGDTVQHITLLPVPILEAEVRASNAILRVEGLPPLAATVQDETTQLSLLNASIRGIVPGDHAYVGIGETLYNQQTAGGPFAVQPYQIHSSRVTGMRLEAGAMTRLRPNDRLQFDIAYNPVMHGIVHTAYQEPLYLPITVNDPEQATQIDIKLWRVISHGRGQFIYGLRYINFTARYVEARTSLDGSLADRNVGLLPLVGYR